MLYATCLETDLIASVAEVPEDRIWKIDRSGAARAASTATTTATTTATHDDSCDERLAEAEQPHASADLDTGTAVRELHRPPVPEASAGGVTGVSAPGAGMARMLRARRTPPSGYPVSLLDSLMNLAGELVLCRNQLSDAVARGDAAMVEAASQSIGVVTSDVQQAVMRTRMQPVGNLFQKFTRFVRDTGRKLNKEARLLIEANEVELDKTIIEGLSDPLSHMVRNAIDHGIGTPAPRRAASPKRARYS